MQKEYYEIYGDIYDGYRLGNAGMRFAQELFFEYGPMRYWHSIRWTTEAIEKSISRLGLIDRMRPDAKHFLLVNLHQLVVLPIMHPSAPGIPSEKLRSMLEQDSELILKMASEPIPNDYEEKESYEISGGKIVRTVAKLWNDLSLSKLEIWG